ncbi:MAG: efflux RND transporter periplasmic adaptor subunit [Planctomycetota bacterium]
MHPQIRQPEPGKCPICGMDLIPVKEGGPEAIGPRQLGMSEESVRLAEIETRRVERRYVDMEIPLVGKVDYDETRVKTISAWVSGRLDRLYVDFTGISVKAGDHLVEMYSPELFSGQEELLQAIRAEENLRQSPSEVLKRSAAETIRAAREKLRLLGLLPAQIEAVVAKGAPTAVVEIKAPAGGIVIEKHATEGMYVETGMPIYTIADLSVVWVRLEAYESDIAWIRYGQEVDITTEAYGDKPFSGRISFIDPELDLETRTVRLRVVAKNPEGLLRPHMFVRAVVRARLAENGRVVSASLQGKWISPMHPEVVKDRPGTCDICGMPLVRAEDLGYASDEEAVPPLVVPASAVLTTGRRAIVYVRVPGRERPTFEGVEVTLGPRAGDAYLVHAGLAEGREVVTNGNFKIDSALQLLAKPSMMNPEGGGPAPAGHAQHAGMGASETAPAAAMPMPATPSTPEETAPAPMPSSSMEMSAPQPLPPAPPVKEGKDLERFQIALSPLYARYFDAHESLAEDKEAEARAALDALARAVESVPGELLPQAGSPQWREVSTGLSRSLEHRAHVAGLEGVRNLFVEVSRMAIRLEQDFGHAGEEAHRLFFCPMFHNGRSAEWLQRGEEMRNPYYGSAMPGCGEIRKVFPGAGAEEGRHESKE